MKRKNKPSVFEMSGKSGDMVYYHLDGQYVGRRYARVPLETYRNGENFANLRKQQSEFGLASQYGKTLRQALHPYLDIFKNADCAGRLTGALRQCLKEGNGMAGERVFSQASLGGLHHFPFDKKYPYSKAFGNEFILRYEEDRVEVGLKPAGLYYPSYMKPMPATIVVGVVLLSPVQFNAGYELLFPEYHGLGFLQEFGVEEVLNAESWNYAVPQNPEIPKGMLQVGMCGYLGEGGHGGRGWLVGGGVGSRE